MIITIDYIQLNPLDFILATDSAAFRAAESIGNVAGLAVTVIFFLSIPYGMYRFYKYATGPNKNEIEKAGWYPGRRVGQTYQSCGSSIVG